MPPVNKSFYCEEFVRSFIMMSKSIRFRLFLSMGSGGFVAWRRYPVVRRNDGIVFSVEGSCHLSTLITKCVCVLALVYVCICISVSYAWLWLIWTLRLYDDPLLSIPLILPLFSTFTILIPHSFECYKRTRTLFSPFEFFF